VIKFGISPLTQGLPGEVDCVRLVEELYREVQDAERYGFDGCFTGEHHQQATGQFTSPLVLSAAVAARTERIKVGSIVLLPLHHPVTIAEDAAMVDIIAKGRSILCPAAGYMAADFDTFGVPPRYRPSLMEEGVEVVKRCWTEDRFSFTGKRYSLHDLSITPKPVQRPHPPIWMAAWSEAGARRAGRLGDAWMSEPIRNLPAVQQLAKVYREEATAHGKMPCVALMRECWVAETTEQAIAEFGPGALYYHRMYYRRGGYLPEWEPWLKDVKSAEDITFEMVAHDRFIIGSPRDCIAQIERWHRETGADYFILRMRQPIGPSHERVREAIKLFGEHVISYFSE